MSRIINGPEDCVPVRGFLQLPGCTHSIEHDYLTAEEVGQIIALAMDAKSKYDETFLDEWLGGPEECEKRIAQVDAWYSLSDKLKGIK